MKNTHGCERTFCSCIAGCMHHAEMPTSHHPDCTYVNPPSDASLEEKTRVVTLAVISRCSECSYCAHGSGITSHAARAGVCRHPALTHEVQGILKHDGRRWKPTDPTEVPPEWCPKRLEAERAVSEEFERAQRHLVRELRRVTYDGVAVWTPFFRNDAEGTVLSTRVWRPMSRIMRGTDGKIHKANNYPRGTVLTGVFI